MHRQHIAPGRLLDVAGGFRSWDNRLARRTVPALVQRVLAGGGRRFAGRHSLALPRFLPRAFIAERDAEQPIAALHDPGPLACLAQAYPGRGAEIVPSEEHAPRHHAVVVVAGSESLLALTESLFALASATFGFLLRRLVAAFSALALA